MDTDVNVQCTFLSLLGSIFVLLLHVTHSRTENCELPKSKGKNRICLSHWNKAKYKNKTCLDHFLFRGPLYFLS